jgi:hypothetical protein
MSERAGWEEPGKAGRRSLTPEWEVVEIDKKERDSAVDRIMVLVVVLTAVTLSVVGGVVTLIATQW